MIDIVIDTDAFNQIDDQYAITYAMLSPQQLNVQAIYAAPFVRSKAPTPAMGMQKSYDEIVRILQLIGDVESKPSVYHGADRWLSDSPQQPVHSDAVQDLINRAMTKSNGEPLYVVAIGAITNIASAIMIEPRLIEKIVVVWLAGQSHHATSAAEYNLQQDLRASQLIFENGVSLVQIPCNGVADTLISTPKMIEQHIKGRSSIGNDLYDLYNQLDLDHLGATKVIWDLAAVAYLINSDWLPTRQVITPILTDQLTWQKQQSGNQTIRRTMQTIRTMRICTACNGPAIYQDFFKKLEYHASLIK